MLPEAAGLGKYFQVSGHSFSLYGPTLSRQKTDLFFPVVNWLTGRFVYATLPLHWLTCPAGLQNVKKPNAQILVE